MRQLAVSAPYGRSQLEYAAGQAVTAWQFGQHLGAGDRMARSGTDDVALGDVQTDDAVVGTDQPAGTFDHAGEQRLERQLAGNLLDHLRQQIELPVQVRIARERRVLESARSCGQRTSGR
jgi:hypothetical protein